MLAGCAIQRQPVRQPRRQANCQLRLSMRGHSNGLPLLPRMLRLRRQWIPPRLRNGRLLDTHPTRTCHLATR